MGSKWMPRAMRVAPRLDPAVWPQSVRRRYALLINPFYPKDPHASFGKHVLTPTLALTSVAASTPQAWDVAYWDENLLQGPPPSQPFPEVVGITVHLTFSNRAYELAHWYRQRGAKVVLGGLHVMSCPDEAAPHADALAIGDGVVLWEKILRDVVFVQALQLVLASAHQASANLWRMASVGGAIPTKAFAFPPPTGETRRGRAWPRRRSRVRRGLREPHT